MRPRTRASAHWRTILAITCGALVGCSETTDRAYGGRSAQQWAEQLHDSSVSARIGAAEALYHIAPRSPRVIGSLLAAMRDSDATVQASVATALGTVGAPAIPGLIEATRDDHASVRAMAISILAGEGADAEAVVPAITRALGDSSEEVRLQAAQSLGATGHAAAAAGPALLETVRRGKGVLKAACLQAADAVGADANTLTGLADSALSDSSAAVRHAALRVRVARAAGPADVIAVVRRMVGDVDVGVRTAAYRALAGIARDSNSSAMAEARQILARGSRDTSAIVRAATAAALAPPEPVRDPDARYRRHP